MKRIAYVDDTSVNRDLFQKIVGHLDIDCLVYAYPNLFELDNPKDISLIVSDIEMGFASVDDTIIVRDRLYPDVPLVVHSGNHDLLKVYQSKGFDVLSKPFRVDDFYLLINKYFFEGK